jgi:GTP-binding protein YchF
VEPHQVRQYFCSHFALISVKIVAMSLSIGIVGLPNVGKSTLFNALTKNNVLAANYPFATIEPNEGIVAVPDERLQKLSDLYDGAPIVPATVKFLDIAGIVAGAHKGEGMGNAFLSHIRETAAIVQVVRAFEDGDIQHVDNHLDPKKDIETINTELILADLQTIENHMPKLNKQAKSDKEARARMALLEQLESKLDEGILAINSGVELEELEYLNLLTAKPFIYVFNVDENTLNDDAKKAELEALAPTKNVVFVSAKIEAEIAQLDGEDAEMFMEEFGLKESGLVRLSQVSFSILGLQTYLTAGEKEVKAWTIKADSTAPQAAGVIHADFERGFIAAEVINFSDLLEAGSRPAAKKTGKVRTEGKTYTMQPDDVVEFRFNV